MLPFASCALLVFCAAPSLAQQAEINPEWQLSHPRSVLAGGGGSSSGGAFKTDGTAGQSAAGTLLSGGGFTQVGGFWGPTGLLASCPHNINDPGNYVCQHYIDFLGRAGDVSGLAFWTNQITTCGSDGPCTEVRRINVSASFFLSIEFQETGYLIYRIYKAAYGNANATSGTGGTHAFSAPMVRFNEFLGDSREIGNGVVVNQPGWEQVLENNKRSFTGRFVQRSRFAALYPTTMTAAQFVDALNANAGNPLSPAERDQLVSDLSSGAKNRGQLLRAVAEDPDLYSAEFNRAFVLMQYFGYLRRNPNDAPEASLDYAGYEFWLSKLNQFGGNYINAEMVRAFISSIEYNNRFRP
jgi:hypothetical protein